MVQSSSSTVYIALVVLLALLVSPSMAQPGTRSKVIHETIPLTCRPSIPSSLSTVTNCTALSDPYSEALCEFEGVIGFGAIALFFIFVGSIVGVIVATFF